MAADRVVVVTATQGFRHESIQLAEQTLSEMAAARNFEVEFVRDVSQLPSSLSAASLATTKLVIFANTTGDLEFPGRDALLQWVLNGGSFMGVHSASDTWHGWPEYIAMLGGEFETHPAEASVVVHVEDRNHPATSRIESPHPLFEEIYYFKNFTPESVHLLLALHASPEDGQPGFFPLAWWRPYGMGRVFYTALGHREDVWRSPWFRSHLAGAIDWGLDRETNPRRRAVIRGER
jgi:type 1 glutamine amidotransferase